MNKKIKYEHTAINREVKNLLEMFEFYLMERQLDKSIDVLADAVRDIRIIVQRLLAGYFLTLEPEEEIKFCAALATMLAQRCKKLPDITKEDKKYFDYCIAEILLCFEWAQEIKSEFPDDLISQQTLMLDIPLLRPFDYGVRTKFRVVKSTPKKKKKK